MAEKVCGLVGEAFPAEAKEFEDDDASGEEARIRDIAAISDKDTSELTHLDVPSTAWPCKMAEKVCGLVGEAFPAEAKEFEDDDASGEDARIRDIPEACAENSFSVTLFWRSSIRKDV